MSDLTPYVNVLTNEFVGTVIRERDPEKSLTKDYLYPRVMPLQEVPEDRMTWKEIKAQSPLAGVYSQDGRPVPAGEISAEQRYAEIARIMANRILDETSVKTLKGISHLAPLAIDVSHEVVLGPARRHTEIITKYILDCDNQIEAQLEYFCLQALQGHVSWPPKDENGDPVLAQGEPYWGTSTLEVPLPFPSAFIADYSTLVGGDHTAWNDPAADIIADLDAMRLIMSDETGVDTDDLTLIMSRRDLRYLLKNTGIKEALRNVTSAGVLSNPTEADIRRNLGILLNVTIVLYDQKWTYATWSGVGKETLHKIRYLPLGRVLVLPGTGLRQVGVMGTSPAKGPDSEWKANKFTWFYETKNAPFTTEVGVGINAFPMYQEYDSHMVFTMY